MASPPQPEPEEILRAAVTSPGEGTLGDLARHADRVQGILEKLDEPELRRSYATLARIVGGAEKGEAPDEGGSPLRAMSAVLERMRGALPLARFAEAPGLESAAPPGPARKTARPPEPPASGSAAEEASVEVDLDLWDRELEALRRSIAEGALADARGRLGLLDALREAAEEAGTLDREALARLRDERDAAARALAAAETDLAPQDPDPSPETETRPRDPRALLLDVPGRAVPLAALDEATVDDGHLLAYTLSRLLHRAAESARAQILPASGADSAPVIVVTPAAFLLAALDEAREEAAPPSICVALRRWAERLDALPEALGREGAFDPGRVAGAEVLVGPDLRGVLAGAAQLAADVRETFDARGRKFAVASLVLSPKGRQAFVDLEMVRGDPGAFFHELALWLADWLVEDDARHDRADWARWLEANPVPPPEALVEGLNLREPLRLSVPDYAADDVARRRGAGASMLAGDRLGVAADARALADLICLEAARPPLAIGLFGPWGSGKSTFMRMIEEAAEANRETARRMGEGSPFVANVAHVWFNAWHYLDANLWASLVSHIFRELHRLDRGVDDEEARRIDYLVERLPSAAQAETVARQTLRTADAEVERARRRVAAADRLRLCLRRKLARAAPRALDEMLEDETRRGLSALRDAGLPVPLQSVEQLRDLRRELSGLGGRLRLLGSAILRGGGRTWRALGLAALVLLGLGAASAWLAYGRDAEAALPGWLRMLASDAAALAAAVGAAVAAIRPHLARADAALDALAAAEEEARAKLAAAEAERRRLEADLARLEAERLRAQDALDARRRERERLEAMRRGEQPAELLAQFIEDRARAEGYRKHLGLLSQIRADFELMADLLAPRSEAARADAARRIEADPAALPHIGRIVLYIDDLDRCRDEQVVEVLEAIHLLLAFDLFVVVVGVDARWVEGALARFYAQQLSAGEAPDGRPSVADYLEKIFQIPFRLRPMALGEGGGYSRLVAEIVGPVQEPRAEPPAPERPDATAGPEAGDAADAPAPAGPPPLPAIDLSAVWPPEETPAQVLERVTLTRAELEAIEALGPLVGRSPRTAKRFVNLYRLLRSRRRGVELEAFLAEIDNGAAAYEVALFWLAMEVGLTQSQMDFVVTQIAANPLWTARTFTWVAFGDERSTQTETFEGREAGERLASEAFWASAAVSGVRAALIDGFERIGDVDPEIRAELIREASRYSFRFGGSL
ncbi:MAG: P-loop NTPase fold protein [Albimonas sp.]|uniref:P-loop NTPase fold protein n=1 Tax=Albimonas sp. TaxID=1872425 RepID=UPI0040566103